MAFISFSFDFHGESKSFLQFDVNLIFQDIFFVTPGHSCHNNNNSVNNQQVRSSYLSAYPKFESKCVK